MDIRHKQIPRAPKLYVIDEESLKFLAGQKSPLQRTRYQESCALFSANQPEPLSPEVVTFITRLKEVGYTGTDESDSTDRSPLVVVGELDDLHSSEIWKSILRLKSLREQQVKQCYSPYDSLPINIEVGIWDQKQVSLLPEEHTKKTIFIKELSGCCALAMIVKCKSGTRHAIMSQCPPQETQVEDLKRAIAQINNDQIIYKTLVVLTGGTIAKINDKIYQLKPTSEYLSHIGLLRDAAQIVPRVFAYFESDHNKAKDYPDFRVELSHAGATWYYVGDSHKPHRLDE